MTGDVHASERRLEWLADPVRFQVLFAGLYLADLGLRVAFGQRFALASGPGIGVAMVLATTLVALVVPWRRMAPWVSGALPILDIAAIGVTRLHPDGGNGLLIVFPALWLGRTWGRRGAVVATLATAVFVVVPGGLYAGVDPALLSRALFFPVVAAATALVIALGMEQVDAQHSEMEHQRRVSQAIFDSADVGLLLLDRSGGYVGLNRRHQEFMALAYPAGHAGQAGQTGEVFDVDGHTPMTREQLPTHLASHGEEFDGIQMWVGSDPDTRRALSVSARTVRDDKGDFAGAALAYTDITDLMRALRVKDEFVALVSHELRTPLTSIVGYVQILEEDGEVPEHARRQLGVVHRNADRLYRLITDLLELASRDGRPLELVRSSVDLSVVVRESAEAARPAAASAGVEIGVDAPPTVTMRVDAQRVAQVVDNLVSNAIKYTEPGGRVDVRLEADEGGVQIAVTDTGIGISAEDRARLFTPFFRTADASRRAVAGAGLGLSITRAIVVAHGGSIEVDSELGRGSVFRVRLPA